MLHPTLANAGHHVRVWAKILAAEPKEIPVTSQHAGSLPQMQVCYVGNHHGAVATGMMSPAMPSPRQNTRIGLPIWTESTAGAHLRMKRRDAWSRRDT